MPVTRGAGDLESIAVMVLVADDVGEQDITVGVLDETDRDAGDWILINPASMRQSAGTDRRRRAGAV